MLGTCQRLRKCYFSWCLVCSLFLSLFPVYISILNRILEWLTRMAHKPDNERMVHISSWRRVGNVFRKQNLSAEGCRISHKARIYLLVRSGKDSSLSISIHLIHGKQSVWRAAFLCVFFFLRQKPFKPVWSCLRFKWQFSESQIVFFALSRTMITVIEQNVVFSTEVYECRHLRWYFQSSLCRLSRVSPLQSWWRQARCKEALLLLPSKCPWQQECKCPSFGPTNYPISLWLLFN